MVNGNVLEKSARISHDPHKASTNGVESTGAAQALCAQLANEFSAPVAVFQARDRRWLLTVGAPEESFPEQDSQLCKIVDSSGIRQGKVAIWRRYEEAEVVWMVMPVPSTDSTPLVVFAGFRAKFDSTCEGERVKWGPACPEPALRAWGQQALDRLRQAHEARQLPTNPSIASSDEECEHVVIGRLIRRMRISESPARFQSLATNVLRTSLNMAAAGWIPNDSREPVVVSGSIEGLCTGTYRRLIPSNSRDSFYLVNNAAMTPGGADVPQVQRYACVPAGSAGWLVAANPLLGRAIEPADIERMQYVASLIATQLINSRTYAELKELLFGIIRALTAAIDAKDPYTSGHSERVARIAVRLAEELGMPAQKRGDLYLAGLLHDIGKIGIDDFVLKKTGPLTPEEYRAIQAHVEIGVTILKDLKKLSHILPGVRHHHESLDGTGYPARLSGEQIPLEARILAVADSFDAMSSNRPYRKRLTPMQIDDILRKGRGTQWDPKVIDALFACRMDAEAIRQKGLGESLIGAVDQTLGRS
jgi:putative nucleotidyltransferase with HDIG domain